MAAERKQDIVITGGRIPTRSERLPEQRIVTEMNEDGLIVYCKWLFEVILYPDNGTGLLIYLEQESPGPFMTANSKYAITVLKPDLVQKHIDIEWTISQSDEESAMIRLDSKDNLAFWMQLRVPKTHPLLKNTKA